MPPLSVSSAIDAILSPPTYIDGKPKPYYRGLIHGSFFFIFTLATAISFVKVLHISIEDEIEDESSQPDPDPAHSLKHLQYFGLTALFFGKALSYFASALLHLFPFKSSLFVTKALKFDLIAIAVSIGFTALPFINTRSEGLLVFGLTVGFVIIQLLSVEWQFFRHIGLDTPENRTDIPRNFILIIQFLYTCSLIGKNLGYSNIFWATFVAYAVSFSLAGPVTASHEHEPVVSFFKWHKVKVWSLHEDFHAALLVSDLMMIYMAVGKMQNGEI